MTPGFEAQLKKEYRLGEEDISYINEAHDSIAPETAEADQAFRDLVFRITDGFIKVLSNIAPIHVGRRLGIEKNYRQHLFRTLVGASSEQDMSPYVHSARRFHAFGRTVLKSKGKLDRIPTTNNG